MLRFRLPPHKSTREENMQDTLSKLTSCIAVCLLILSTSNALAQSAEEHRGTIKRLLDDFHAAAAAADRDRYLGHFAPDGVFMGTDDWERWPLPAFSHYVDGRFSEGVGWTYVAQDRHIMFSHDEQTAWFDEVMVSTRWGRFRGTGVLVTIDGDWKIAHYSLTALVPNEAFEDVAAVATAGFKARDKESDK